MSQLTPLDEALAQVLAAVPGTPEQTRVALLDALGLVLAEDVVSAVAVPGEDNSAMDGYALRAAEASQLLPVSQRIAAGQPGAELSPGSAARISCASASYTSDGAATVCLVAAPSSAPGVSSAIHRLPHPALQMHDRMF